MNWCGERLLQQALVKRSLMVGHNFFVFGEMFFRPYVNFTGIGC